MVLKWKIGEKLENSKICGNSITYSWTTNGTKKVSKEKKNLETNKSENTTYQNLWDHAKVVLNCIKKKESSQITRKL